MKYFNKVFDVFLYESICILFFGGLLYILNDPISPSLFLISVVFAGIAAVLGFIGRFFHLFPHDHEED
jgi:formate-dependent nitrite reductase membrane component NrfD